MIADIAKNLEGIGWKELYKILVVVSHTNRHTAYLLGSGNGPVT
jgi:hypothetical protein